MLCSVLASVLHLASRGQAGCAKRMREGIKMQTGPSRALPTSQATTPRDRRPKVPPLKNPALGPGASRCPGQSP